MSPGELWLHSRPPERPGTLASPIAWGPRRQRLVRKSWAPRLGRDPGLVGPSWGGPPYPRLSKVHRSGGCRTLGAPGHPERTPPRPCLPTPGEHFAETSLLGALGARVTKAWGGVSHPSLCLGCTQGQHMLCSSFWGSAGRCPASLHQPDWTSLRTGPRQTYLRSPLTSWARPTAVVERRHQLRSRVFIPVSATSGQDLEGRVSPVPQRECGRDRRPQTRQCPRRACVRQPCGGCVGPTGSAGSEWARCTVQLPHGTRAAWTPAPNTHPAQGFHYP